MNDRKTFWIYMIEVDSGSFYTGMTVDLDRRYGEHLKGKARYTRGFKPVRLVQAWRFRGTIGTAMKIEKLIKRQKRSAKEDMIEKPRTLAKLVKEKLELRIRLTRVDPDRLRHLSEGTTDGTGGGVE